MRQNVRLHERTYIIEEFYTNTKHFRLQTVYNSTSDSSTVLKTSKGTSRRLLYDDDW